MNMDKRYCQNRGRKRKRTIVPSPVDYKNISPAEEERQFKLKRFVEDVDKYLSQKENGPGQKMIPERNSSNKKHRVVKKVNIPIPTIKRGLYQNGIQTKFYTRGGVTTKEMTSRLDENMRQIISLGNNDQYSLCTHHCKRQINQNGGLGSSKCGMEPQRLSVPAYSLTRSSPSCEEVHPSLSSHSVLAGGKQVVTVSDGGSKTLSELDKELYPLFARVVSVSCTQTRSVLFKNQSYVSAVKRKLLDIHVNGIEGDKRKLNCLVEHKKATSSVGTSPLPSSSKSLSPLHKSREQPFKLNAPRFRFQSTMDYLEEEIGPVSTSTSKQMNLSPQCCQPYFESRQLQQSLLSPPVVNYQRCKQNTMYLPKLAKYVHEPFVPSRTPLMSMYKFRQKELDGRGDGFNFNCLNSFLPPIQEEEDSPDFRYYPRKIF